MREVVAGDGPVLLVIDDIHALDARSRGVLLAVLRRFAFSPTLVVAASRTKMTDTLTAPPDPSTVDVAWDMSLVLQPLQTPEVHEMIRALQLDSEHLPQPHLNALTKLAAGYPQLVEVLIQDLHESGRGSLVSSHVAGRRSARFWHPPEMIRRALARQYKDLSTQSGTVLNLIAVAGRKMSAWEMSLASGLTETEAEYAALELLARGILRLDANRFTFRTELHREFVYGTMRPEHRKYHHAKIGNYLRRIAEQHEFARTLEASHHFVSAGMLEQGIESVLSSSSAATAHGAAREVEVALRSLSSEIQPKYASLVYLHLSQALAAQGKYRDTIATLEQVQTSSVAPADRLRMTILRAEALHRGRLDSDDAIRSTVQAALELAFEVGTETDQLQALQISAEFASESGDQQTLTRVELATKRIRLNTTDATVRARATLNNAYCLLTSGATAAAAHEFEQCISPLRDHARDSELRRALNGSAICQLSIGEFAGAVRSLTEAADVAEQYGDFDAAANSWSNLGTVHEDLGEFVKSAGCYEQAILAVKEVASSRRLAELTVNLAGFALLLGLVDKARSLSAAAEQHARDARQWRLMVDVFNVMADCELARGNTEAAGVYIEEALTASDDRVYLLADLGRHERLRRFHVLLRDGEDALKELIETEDLEDRCPQVADQVEVRLFEEWATRRCAQGSDQPMGAVSRARELGLHGVIARLESLGIVLQDVSEGMSGEPTAERAVRHVVPRHRQELEDASAKCLSLAEQLQIDRTSPPGPDQTGFRSSV
jgi:tetratricopeptide (TPR) repeat protein